LKATSRYLKFHSVGHKKKISSKDKEIDPFLQSDFDGKPFKNARISDRKTLLIALDSMLFLNGVVFLKAIF